jgi:hypothetical protein
MCRCINVAKHVARHRNFSKAVLDDIVRTKTSGAWHETELLHNGKRVRHDGGFEGFAVTNGALVDRHPLDAVARAGTSEELPATGTTETIDEYDLVAFRDSLEHLGSRVGDRLIEHLVEPSPSSVSRPRGVRRKG